MKTWRVLVTRRLYPEALDLLRAELEVTYYDSRDGLPAVELAAAVADHEAMICQLTDPIDAAILDAGAALRIVANVAVGHDNIDVAAATQRGIVVTNTPGVLTESTADLAFALLMACARRVTEAERFLRSGAWQQWEIDLMAGRDVHGSTLGIVGMGRIGRAVARRARGFGMRILYHSRTRVDPVLESELGVEFADFDELLSESDFVSLHVPMDNRTRDLIGPRELDRMKSTAILINTARGPVVDEDALVTALRSGGIGGAGLDVFRLEPKFDTRLAEFDNVVLLPHIASATVATRTEMCCMAARDVLALAAGRTPTHPVET